MVKCYHVEKLHGVNWYEQQLMRYSVTVLPWKRIAIATRHPLGPPGSKIWNDNE